jgi:hypothetical protein
MRVQAGRVALLAGIFSVGLIGGPLAADSAPQIALSGTLYTDFVLLRPYLALGLFLFGAYSILYYGVQLLRLRLAHPASAEAALHQPTLQHLLAHVLFVVVTIAFLVAVLYAGLDVFNSLLKFLWNAAGDSTIVT